MIEHTPMSPEADNRLVRYCESECTLKNALIAIGKVCKKKIEKGKGFK